MNEKLKNIIREEIITLLEKSPPGWKGTVKAMKKHKDIDNPWALAWHMKNKGDNPHYKDKEGNPEKKKKYKKEEKIKEIIRSVIEEKFDIKHRKQAYKDYQLWQKIRDEIVRFQNSLMKYAKHSAKALQINAKGLDKFEKIYVNEVLKYLDSFQDDQYQLDKDWESFYD